MSSQESLLTLAITCNLRSPWLKIIKLYLYETISGSLVNNERPGQKERDTVVCSLPVGAVNYICGRDVLGHVCSTSIAPHRLQNYDDLSLYSSGRQQHQRFGWVRERSDAEPSPTIWENNRRPEYLSSDRQGRMLWSARGERSRKNHNVQHDDRGHCHDFWERVSVWL